MITMTFKSLARSVAMSGLIGLGALLTSGAVLAQELKIGYVNSERVLREAAPAKAALARMEADFSKRDKDLNDQAGKLKAAADKLEKDAPTLPESERNRRQRELVEQEVARGNAKLAQVSQIRKFHLLTKELDHDDGEVTATMKVRRSSIYKTYADEIEALYA